MCHSLLFLGEPWCCLEPGSRSSAPHPIPAFSLEISKRKKKKRENFYRNFCRCVFAAALKFLEHRKNQIRYVEGRVSPKGYWRWHFFFFKACKMEGNWGLIGRKKIAWSVKKVIEKQYVRFFFGGGGVCASLEILIITVFHCSGRFIFGVN